MKCQISLVDFFSIDDIYSSFKIENRAFPDCSRVDLGVALEGLFRVDHDLTVGVDRYGTVAERERHRPSSPNVSLGPVVDDRVQRVGIDASGERLEILERDAADRRDGCGECRRHRFVVGGVTPHVIRPRMSS